MTQDQKCLDLRGQSCVKTCVIKTNPGNADIDKVTQKDKSFGWKRRKRVLNFGNRGGGTKTFYVWQTLSAGKKNFVDIEIWWKSFLSASETRSPLFKHLLRKWTVVKFRTKQQQQQQSYFCSPPLLLSVVHFHTKFVIATTELKSGVAERGNAGGQPLAPPHFRLALAIPVHFYGILSLTQRSDGF